MQVFSSSMLTRFVQNLFKCIYLNLRTPIINTHSHYRMLSPILNIHSRNLRSPFINAHSHDQCSLPLSILTPINNAHSRKCIEVSMFQSKNSHYQCSLPSTMLTHSSLYYHKFKCFNLRTPIINSHSHYQRSVSARRLLPCSRTRPNTRQLEPTARLSHSTGQPCTLCSYWCPNNIGLDQTCPPGKGRIGLPRSSLDSSSQLDKAKGWSLGRLQLFVME